MSILVVCPGCRKRFSVSDKFAGQTGPCPNCKTKIRVPTKEEEVKIHAPTEFAAGARDARAQAAAKPIARKETPWNPVVAGVITGTVLLVFLGAWLGGRAGLLDDLWGRGIGLLLVSPPLVVAGYTFLRDSDDLFPYHGRVLYLRAGICSLIYIALWGVYGYLVGEQIVSGELWNWIFVLPPFFVAGAMVALMCLDLDFGSGFFHYCFYILATVLLGWAAGAGWPWEISNA